MEKKAGSPLNKKRQKQHYGKHKNSPESRCVESAPMIPGWKYYYSLIHGHTDMAPTNYLRTFWGHFPRFFHHIRHFKNSRWCTFEKQSSKPQCFQGVAGFVQLLPWYMAARGDAEARNLSSKPLSRLRVCYSTSFSTRQEGVLKKLWTILTYFVNSYVFPAIADSAKDPGAFAAPQHTEDNNFRWIRVSVASSCAAVI